METFRALQEALQHHHAGRLAAAETLYRRVLAADPKNADALHLLGVLAHQVNNHQAAIDLIRAAVQHNPGDARFYHNLGTACAAMNRLDDAIACYRKCLELADLVDGHYNLGLALNRAGRHGEAARAFQETIARKPDHAEAWASLSAALLALEEYSRADQVAQHACAIAPNLAIAHVNRATALMNLGHGDAALVCCERALALDPGLAEAYTTLGFLRHVHLGDIPGAIAALKTAQALAPHLAEIHAGLANVYKDDGAIGQAVEAYRRATALNPTSAAVGSNLCYAILFDPACDAAAILAEQRRWQSVHAEPLRHTHRPHPNDCSTDRRLRIGYISPNFTDHPVGRMILEVLANHDHASFEVFCYSNVRRREALTDVARLYASHWREIGGMPDADVAQLIRKDRIDILIDLAAHLGGSRLLTLARKPAPVQMTHMAYPATTGLSAIDYRITDRHLDPEDCEPHSAERLLRLPHSYWFYVYDGTEPPVGPSPVQRNGVGTRGHGVTFGSLNNPCKHGPAAVELFGRVLHAVPRSRLMLMCSDRSGRGDHVTQQFALHGIASDRLTFVSQRPRRAYLELYNQIDIALDPLPYGSHTTGLDALYMSVPLVTLPGDTPVGRAGVSLLKSMKLDSLIAQNAEHYVQLAQRLASDIPALSRMRASLRDRMRASPLSDARRYTRALERLYREAWREYCKSPRVHASSRSAPRGAFDVAKSFTA